MYFTRSIVASAVLGMAAAQSSSAIMASESLSAAPAASTMGAASSAGEVATHVIQVGGANATDLIFSPNNIQAAVGDLVQFQFRPKNHSVVQTTFGAPCTPIQNSMPNKTDAFFSGYMPVAAADMAAGKQLTYTIRVMDTKPIWFYCSQATHCMAGMVGAINAATTGNNSMTNYIANAKAATENLTPGQVAGQGNAKGAAAGGSAGSSAAAGSAGAGGAAATGTDAAAAAGGAGASSTNSAGVAQQTTSGAVNVGPQSVLAFVACAMAAFALL